MKYDHGLSNTKIYKVWNSMMERCHNLNSSNYSRYGAKGISVCDDWHNPRIFISWALINGFAENLTIERKNFNFGYTPNNCTWILLKDQAKNRGKSVKNTSGYVGVNYHKVKKAWSARITIEGIRKEIGLYNSAEQAHNARTQYFISNDLTEYLKIHELQHNIPKDSSSIK